MEYAYICHVSGAKFHHLQHAVRGAVALGKRLEINATFGSAPWDRRCTTMTGTRTHADQEVLTSGVWLTMARILERNRLPRASCQEGRATINPGMPRRVF